MDEIVMTSAGNEELELELRRLRAEYEAGETRLAGAMEDAGDANEVGEYLDVQREQDLLGRRIALVEEWLDNARVVPVSTRPHDAAEIGAEAEFEDVDTGERSTFELVSSPEANVARGRLSIESPVGHALVGHHVGETVEVVTPKGRRHLRLLAVR